MIFLCVRSLAPYLNGYFNNILLTNFMYSIYVFTFLQIPMSNQSLNPFDLTAPLQFFKVMSIHF